MVGIDRVWTLGGFRMQAEVCCGMVLAENEAMRKESKNSKFQWILAVYVDEEGTAQRERGVGGVSN